MYFRSDVYTHIYRHIAHCLVLFLSPLTDLHLKTHLCNLCLEFDCSVFSIFYLSLKMYELYMLMLIVVCNECVDICIKI